MAKIIAIANQKGGVGKTTTAVNYMWTMFLLYLILKEKITKRKVAGVIFVLIGAVFVSIK